MGKYGQRTGVAGVSRTICILVVVLALGAVMAGCSSGTGTTGGPNTSNKSVEELHQMAKEAINRGDFEEAYLISKELIEKDPNRVESYMNAASALYGMTAANIDEINDILAEGVVNASEHAGAIAQWVSEHQPNFAITLPFISDSNPDQVNVIGNTGGNMMNGERRGGQLARQGDWIYFASRHEGDTLYKMHVNGNIIEKVTDDPVAFLNVSGDFIYYVNLGDNNKLYKIRTDGAERAVISEHSCEYVSMSDGWLYYLSFSEDDEGFFKIRPDGSEGAKISSEFMKYPYVWDEWAYYASKQNNGSVGRVRTDGTGAEWLTDHRTIEHLLSDGWVYYLAEKNTPGMLFARVRYDGSKRQDILDYDAKIYSMNVDGNRIYVAVRDASNDEKVLILNAETFEVEQTLDNLGTEIICTAGDDWLYYVDPLDGDMWYRVNVVSGEREKMR